MNRLGLTIGLGLILLGAMLLWGCGTSQPEARPGTAMSAAITAQARASAIQTSADEAEATAVRSEAEAITAEAVAKQKPSSSADEAASKARAKASVDALIAKSMRAAADRATAKAERATSDAATAVTEERAQQDARDRKSRAWWIAAIATAAAACGAALLLGLSAPIRWLILPAVVAGGGWALYAWALWATWIAATVGGLFLLGIVALAIAVVRHVVKVEWPDAVDSLRSIGPDAAEAHNIISRGRQSKPVRKVVDWLLRTPAKR